MSEILLMTTDHKHKITVRVSGVEPFDIPINESEESFYRMVLDKINYNVDKFRYGANPDTDTVALAKVLLYYATLSYRRVQQINAQSELLGSFEKRLDSLLEGLEEPAG